MSNHETHNLAVTDPERMAEVQRHADFYLANLFSNRSKLAVEILICIIASFFLRIKTVPGITKLEAFDLYMAAARKTLEGNLEDGS